MFRRQALCQFAVIRFGVDAVAGLHLVEDVSPECVLRRNRDAWRADGVQFVFSHERGADLLIREDVGPGRMVDREQFHLVEVARFPQFLGDVQQVLTLLCLEFVTVDLEIFPLAPRGDDRFGELQADGGVPQQVGHKRELLTVPRVEIRARPDQLLLFTDVQVRFGRDQVTRNTVGPDHAHDVRLLLRPKAKVRDRPRDDLSQILGTCLQLDRAADPGVIDSLAVVLLVRLDLLREERNVEPSVRVAAVVGEPLGCCRICCEQVLVPVSVDVGDGKRCHSREIDDQRGKLAVDIAAPQPRPLFIQGREIPNSVVVEVERSNAQYGGLIGALGLFHRDHSRSGDLCHYQIQSVWSGSDHVPRTVVVELFDEQ